MLFFKPVKIPTRTPKHTDWLDLEVCLELAGAALLAVVVYRWLL
jgi:hypothetical protein